MTSAKQIRANRANAARSTGPQSEMGRGRVSRNALRHGLSVRADPQSDESRQAVERLAAEFVAECASPDAAHDLAVTLLEWDRNEAAQRKIFRDLFCQDTTPLHGEELVLATRSAYREYRDIEAEIEAEINYATRPNRGWIARGRRLMQRLEADVARQRDRDRSRAWRDLSASQRYLKRASNQLAKALRAALQTQ
jgi:hypothetical protein